MNVNPITPSDDQQQKQRFAAQRQRLIDEQDDAVRQSLYAQMDMYDDKRQTLQESRDLELLQSWEASIRKKADNRRSSQIKKQLEAKAKAKLDQEAAFRKAQDELREFKNPVPAAEVAVVAMAAPLTKCKNCGENGHTKLQCTKMCASIAKCSPAVDEFGTRLAQAMNVEAEPRHAQAMNAQAMNAQAMNAQAMNTEAAPDVDFQIWLKQRRETWRENNYKPPPRPPPPPPPPPRPPPLPYQSNKPRIVFAPHPNSMMLQSTPPHPNAHSNSNK